MKLYSVHLKEQRFTLFKKSFCVSGKCLFFLLENFVNKDLNVIK